MLFSVVVPVYNMECYLKECIESIINQSFEDYEIILIDDGSTDTSSEICEYYYKKNKSKIKVFHKKNEGLLCARRDGYNHASGEYIINCDSDDFISPRSFEILANIINEYNPDIIQYDCYFYEQGKSWNSNEFASPFKEYYLYDNISLLREVFLEHKYMVWSLCGKCYRRKCLDKEYDYSTFKNIKFGEDTLQSFEIYDNARSFIYIPDVIYNYRVSTGMTAKLPIKGIEDNYVISGLYLNYAQKWGYKDYLYKSNSFFLKYVYEFLLNVSKNNYSYSELKELLSRISNNGNFVVMFKKYKKDELCNEYMRKKEYMLLYLLFHNHYVVLYLLFAARRLAKK